MAMQTDPIFRQTVRLASRIQGETNTNVLSKLNSALSILSSAMTLSGTDNSKARRLIILAKNISGVSSNDD